MSVQSWEGAAGFGPADRPAGSADTDLGAAPLGERRTRIAELDVGPRPVLEDLTLVIPTLGRALLEDCLASIAMGDAWPAALIIVDQGGNPQVAEWAKMLREMGASTERVVAPRRGRAAAVNRGVERVRTRFFAVTDDDCLVEPDWLRTMAERLRMSPHAIVTGRVEPTGDESVVAVTTSRQPATYRRPRLKHDSMSGGNMGAAVDVAREVGPFDEDPCLATAEDCEYSYRALRAGVPITYVPEAVVRHVGWRDQKQRCAQYDLYARSLAGFFGKYLRRGDGFIAVRVVIHLLRSLKRWTRGMATRDRELARNGRAYLRGLLPGLLAGWRSARRR